MKACDLVICLQNLELISDISSSLWYKPSNGMQLHIDSLKPIVYVTTHDRKRTFLTEHKMISNSEDSFKNLLTRAYVFDIYGKISSQLRSYSFHC